MATFTIKITDLERKVNINTADQAMLDQVMSVMGADANERPTIVGQHSAIGLIRDDNTHINGAESDYYQGLTPPYYAKNGPMDDISELLLIKGIRDNPEIYSSDYANVATGGSLWQPDSAAWNMRRIWWMFSRRFPPDESISTRRTALCCK